ncbi:NADPH-dependent assimilatory sulfite reductase hemoprotein subunit [Rickettsiales bacterium]|nr:NADPH-dependent assimilatory sulfite reductase hemoprotein subunit [Rickettsiales bacterium]
MTDEIKLSKQEGYKEESQYLQGDILQELNDENEFVSDKSYELLKFHGSYQGYDRDTATERKKAGLDKQWEFMLRMKAAGGRLTAKQYLALDKICEDYANGTLRITTRETFQFHCIIKENLAKHVKAINELLLTTIGGCGDVVRNVMCPPAPIKNAKYQRMFADANRISEHTMPKTKAYQALWTDGVTVEQRSDDVEPLYGKTYLTRKFKIGVAIAEDNSIDVLSHDLGIVPIFDGDNLQGYNIYLGGGLGMNHNQPKTYSRLASPIAFIEESDLILAVEAAVKLNRDYCDRENRKHARLKYLVEEKGVEWTKKTFDGFMGKETQPAREIEKFDVVDHMGWHPQGDGKYYLGVPISSGRIADFEDVKARTALRQIISKYNMDLVLTSDQNIILCDIEEDQREEIESQLKAAGLSLREDLSEVSRYALACVALPTCGKALSEAERVKIPMIETIEKVMDRHGVLNEKISVRIAGCPNGCSRAAMGDIGIIGRTPGQYALFIGGDFEGTRLNKKILDKLPYENIEEVMDIMFAQYASEKNSGEKFGDFADRIGVDNVVGKIVDNLGDKYKWATAA